MLNTFLYSIFIQFDGDNAALSRQDPILSYRNSLFDAVAADGALRGILTVASAACDAVDRWPGSAGLPRAHVLHPAFPDVAQLLRSSVAPSVPPLHPIIVTSKTRRSDE